MNTFSTSRTLRAAPAEVFAAFSHGERLARWWGPEGFSSRFEVFDFRPGGRWVFEMIGPDGAVYANESVFSAIAPERHVVIRHACQPHFTLTVTLSPVGSDTLLHWEQVFDDPSVAQAVRHIVEPANEQNLDRLEAELSRRWTEAPRA